MSRKIGLCDIHFDPDIEGDIDFDFFSDDVEKDADQTRDDEGDGDIEQNFLTKSTTNLTATSNPTRIPGRLRIRKFESESGGCKDDDAIEDDHDSDQLIQVEISERLLRTSHEPQMNLSNFIRENETESSVSANLPIKLSVDDRKSDRADQQPSMERSLTPIELLRVTATEMRFGSPLSSDSDSASDLYSLTDSIGEDDFDDDSEITDVSPLSSANMSPLPESPARRRTPEPSRGFSPRPVVSGLRRSVTKATGFQCCNNKPSNGAIDVDEITSVPLSSKTGTSSVDLKLLAKAILELEEERKIKTGTACNSISSTERTSSVEPRSSTTSVRSRSSSMFGPDSSSASRMSLNSAGRKNLSFSNDEVRRIEQENKRLLRRIIDSQKSRRTSTNSQSPMTTSKLASSAVNRMRELKKIEAENLAMLKRLQAAKPTKELSRDFLLKSNSRGGTAVHYNATSMSPSVMSSPGSSQSGSAHQQAMLIGARSRHGAGGRSFSTGSLTSTLQASSCSTTNRNYSGRSRSLKLPNAVVNSVPTVGLVSVGRQGSADGGR